MSNFTKSRDFWLFIAVVIIILGGIAYSVFSGASVSEKKGPTAIAPVTPESQVKSFVKGFGAQMNRVSLLSPNASSTIKDEYSGYVSQELLASWKKNPESAPGRKTSSPWPSGIVVDSVTKSGSSTYEVQAHVVLKTSKEKASTSTNDNAGTVPILLTVRQKYATTGEYRMTNGWVIEKYQKITPSEKGAGVGTTTSSVTSPENGTSSTGGSGGIVLKKSGDLELLNVSPRSGSVGTRVMLTGQNLDKVAWVHFGPGVIAPKSVHVVDKTTIIFSVPFRLSAACQFSQIHCMIMFAPLKPGSYSVYVTGKEGSKSKSFEFKVTGRNTTPINTTK